MSFHPDSRSHTFELFTRVSDLDTLESHWQQLWRASGTTPFQTFAWNRGWYRHYCDEYDQICVFVFLRNRQPCAIYPFFSKDGAIRLAGDDICDIQDAIAADQSAIDQSLPVVWNWAVRHRQQIVLEKLSEHGRLYRATRRFRQLQSGGLRCHSFFGPCPYLELPASLDQLLAQLPRKIRKDFKRHLNKLNRELPQCRVDIDSAGNIDTDLLAQVGDFHARHFRQNSLFRDPRFVALVNDVACAPESGLRIGRLHSDRDLMAVCLGFICNGVYYGYLTAFDEAYAHFSPGTCVLLRQIDQWIEKDAVQVLDFLEGADNYKYRYTQTEYKLFSVYLLPLGIKNVLRWIKWQMQGRNKGRCL